MDADEDGWEVICMWCMGLLSAHSTYADARWEADKLRKESSSGSEVVLGFPGLGSGRGHYPGCKCEEQS